MIQMLKFHPFQFSFFGIETRAKETFEIRLIKLFDFNLDAFVLYTLGHHNGRTFFDNIPEQELSPSLSPAQVKRTWAKFNGNQVEEVSWFTAEAVPITMIIAFDE
jgi:hypothetical protein